MLCKVYRHLFTLTTTKLLQLLALRTKDAVGCIVMLAWIISFFIALNPRGLEWVFLLTGNFQPQWIP